jgi:hypothetical protein
VSFTIAAGPRQRSHSRVRVPWDLRPYVTVSDSRLPFSSPPTTRRATVEVFDPASTRVGHSYSRLLPLLSRYGPNRKHHFPLLLYPVVAVETCLFVKPLLGNGFICWLRSSCLEQICHNIDVHRTDWYILLKIHSSLRIKDISVNMATRLWPGQLKNPARFLAGAGSISLFYVTMKWVPQN